MEEMLDVLNEKYQVIGQETRHNVHKKGLLHAAFQCWFYQVIDGMPYLLFQKRNADVNFPNLLDITAAGHLKAGEGPREGAREIKEELGIDITFEDLTALGITEDRLPHDGVRKDWECSHIYVYLFQGEMEALQLNPEEVAGVMRLPLAAFKEMVEDQAVVQEVTAVSYDGEQTTAAVYSLSIRDFVPHTADYYRFFIEKLEEMMDR